MRRLWKSHSWKALINGCSTFGGCGPFSIRFLPIYIYMFESFYFFKIWVASKYKGSVPSFPKTAIKAKQNELSSPFWSHGVAFTTRFPTIYYMYMFEQFSFFSKFGSRDRWRHSLTTWPAKKKKISRKHSKINFRKSHGRPVEKNHYSGSSIRITSRGGHDAPPPRNTEP